VIAEEIQSLSPRFTYVFVTGGIGPTHDDRTRAAVAAGLNRRLAPHPQAGLFLHGGYGETLTTAESAMANLPEGAELLLGMQTRAFGFRVQNVMVFPGVPFFLKDIFERLFPTLVSIPYLVRELWTGSKEGLFSSSLERVQDRFPAVRIGSYPTLSGGRYRARVVLRSRDAVLLAQAEEAVHEALRHCLTVAAAS
jgi:molybdopterin-biosynthesis enzyme MoeA-like protein